MSELKDLVYYMAKALVDVPSEVQVNELEGEQTTVVELKVDQGDLGKVIGQTGAYGSGLENYFKCRFD